MPEANLIIDEAPETKPSLMNLSKVMDDISVQLTGDTIHTPSRFSFEWQGIHFEGQLLHATNDELYPINLMANLGVIPFSAENKSLRKKLRDKLIPLFLRGDLILTQNSMVQLIFLTEFSGPVNARRIMEVITYTLLDQKEKLKSIQVDMNN